MNAEIIMKTNCDYGFQTVLRCAMISGVTQLEDHPGLETLRKNRHKTHLIDAGGMVEDEIERIESGWNMRPAAPGGIHKSPGFRMPMLSSLDNRIDNLSSSLGASKSLIMILGFVFGFSDQSTLVAVSHDGHDYDVVVSETVNEFDALVKIRVSIGIALIQLMEDNAMVRALSAKHKQRLGNVTRIK